MSELIPQLSHKQIKKAIINLAREIFREYSEPIEIRVSDYTIIAIFEDLKIKNENELKPYIFPNGADFIYQLGINKKISFINLHSPYILLNFLS